MKYCILSCNRNFILWNSKISWVATWETVKIITQFKSNWLKWFLRGKRSIKVDLLRYIPEYVCKNLVVFSQDSAGWYPSMSTVYFLCFDSNWNIKLKISLKYMFMLNYLLLYWRKKSQSVKISNCQITFLLLGLKEQFVIPKLPASL